MLWRSYEITPVPAISALALEKHSFMPSVLPLHGILQLDSESLSIDCPQRIFPLCHQWGSQGPPRLLGLYCLVCCSPRPFSVRLGLLHAWGGEDVSKIPPFCPCFGAFALPDPFTRNIFHLPLSAPVQHTLIHPDSVYAPVSLKQPFLNSSFCLTVSACPPFLMPHDIWFIVLIRELMGLCLV